MKKLLLTLAAATLSLVSGMASTVTFDFTSNDYGLPNDKNTYVTTPATISSEGVSILLGQSGSGNAWRMWDDGLREYYSGKPYFTVSANGEPIKAVSWTVVSGATFALEGTTTNITSWEGNETSVTFVSTATKNAAVKTITVTFGEGAEVPDVPETPEYNVAQAIEAINGGYTGEAIITGIVTRTTNFNATYGSITYYISDDGTTTNDLQVYGGLGLNGAKFTSQSDVAVGAKVVVKGNVKLYNNTPEVDMNSELLSYEAPEGGTDPDPDPETPQTGNYADFNTMNSGSANTSYSTYTSANGWVAVNSALLKIGDYLAPTLNGKTTAVGSVTSPTLSNGLGTISFKYQNTYSETKGVSLRIDIKQGNDVVKTQTLTNTSVTQNTAYTFTSEEFNVAGDFVIVITNLSPSNSTSNKDRVSIYDLTWTNFNETGKESAGLAFSATSATATLGQTFTAPVLSKNTDATVTYTSDNTAVATVNAEGVVTIVNLGETTITAETPETDKFNAGKASYKLTVVPGENTVLTVAQAIEAIGNGLTATVQVGGVITSITEVSTSYGNATYIICDEGEDNELTVFRGYWLDGEKFTAEDQLAVGATVVVEGALTLYGSTPEIATGNKLISYTAPVVKGQMTDYTPSYYRFYNDQPEDLANVFRPGIKPAAQFNLGNINNNAYWITKNTNGEGENIFTTENLQTGNVLFGGWLFAQTWTNQNNAAPVFAESLELYDFGGEIGNVLVISGNGSTINEAIADKLNVENPGLNSFDRDFGGNLLMFWVTDYLAMKENMTTADRVHIRLELNAYGNTMDNSVILSDIRYQNEEGTVFPGDPDPIEDITIGQFADENGEWNPYRWMVYEIETPYQPSAAGFVRTLGPAFNKRSLMIRSLEIYSVNGEESELELNTGYFSWNDYTPEQGGEEPEQPTETTATFDFTQPATLTPAYPATVGSNPDGDNTYETVSNVEFTDGLIAVTATKGNSTDARLYYQSSGKIQYRIYNGATLTVSAKDKNTNIKKVEFAFNNSSATPTLALNSEFDGGEYVQSGMTGTFVSENGVEAVTFKASATAQINTITVTYSTTSGVESVETIVVEPVEYFNLQGIRVVNPENGIYIRRQGNNVSKVYIK